MNRFFERLYAWRNRSLTSYSAYAEDALTLAWLEALGHGVSTVTYLDVGAAHPSRLSNTFLLYRRGAKGVLVEPDPEQAAELRKRRPRDTVLNVGVAFDERRQADLIRMSARVFNTFDACQADKVVDASKNWRPDQAQAVKDRVSIDLVPINEIIEKHLHGKAPDFLSIDVESKDIDVLRSLDLARFGPRVICIEASSARELVDELLVPHGYGFTARTPDNFIYVRG